MIKVISILLCFAIAIPLFACGSIPEEHRGAATGAGVGAGAGAIAGALIGDDVGGAVIGGLLGALVGGAIGHYAYDQPRTREQTASAYNYAPTQGIVLNIENASAVPQSIRPGQTVDLKTTYAVLSPNSAAQIGITEIREITHNGQLVGKPEVHVVRTGGTYTSSIPLQLPTNAEKGLYLVKTTVYSEQARDTVDTSFTVL